MFISSVAKDMNKLELPFTSGGTVKLYNHSRKQFGSSLNKHAPVIWPVIHGIYTREIKAYIYILYSGSEK